MKHAGVRAQQGIEASRLRWCFQSQKLSHLAQLRHRQRFAQVVHLGLHVARAARAAGAGVGDGVVHVRSKSKNAQWRSSRPWPDLEHSLLEKRRPGCGVCSPSAPPHPSTRATLSCPHGPLARVRRPARRVALVRSRAHAQAAGDAGGDEHGAVVSLWKE